MSTAISTNFNEGYLFIENKDGTVTTKENGKIGVVKSGIETGSSAQIIYEVPISNGDEIEFEIFGRRLKGKPRISFNFYNKDMVVTHDAIIWEEVTTNEFKKYKIKTVVPYGKEVYRAEIVFGTWTRLGIETEAEFMLPSLKVNSVYGQLQNMAYGLIRVRSSGVGINDNFKNMGVENLSYDSEEKKIIVKLHARNRRRGVDPLIFVTGTTNGVEFPLAGKWNNAEGTFEIGFSNGTEFIALDSGDRYVFFEVKG